MTNERQRVTGYTAVTVPPGDEPPDRVRPSRISSAWPGCSACRCSCGWCSAWHSPARDWWAVGLLIASAASDWLDGKIARALNQESRLGRLLDPAADRLYIAATVVALAVRAIIPWWLVAVLAARELLMAVVLAVLRRRGWGTLQVSFVGKTATLCLLYAFPLLFLGSHVAGYAETAKVAGWTFAIWGCALYWCSALLYVVQARRLLAAPPAAARQAGAPKVRRLGGREARGNAVKAVVMAGGEGTRLRPMTANQPKPMLPVVNRPIMEHVLRLLRRHGLTETVVTVQFLASMVRNYFGDGEDFGMSLQYATEETPLGTAGSVKNAEDALRDEPFLVISGDALTDIDLSDLIAFHKDNNALVTVALARVPDPLEFGIVIVDDDGKIQRFLEKPTWGQVFSDTVNTGIYVMEPEVLDHVPAGQVVDWSGRRVPQAAGERSAAVRLDRRRLLGGCRLARELPQGTGRRTDRQGQRAPRRIRGVTRRLDR